jgi:hypothetical protein
MVKPETIRKGSKVYFADTRDEPVTVIDNSNGEISVMLGKVIHAHPEDLYPVPLIPALITRCGFIKTDQFVFEYPGQDIELEYDYKGVTHMRIHKKNKTLEITALHELQYEFWVFTNKELLFV